MGKFLLVFLAAGGFERFHLAKDEWDNSQFPKNIFIIYTLKKEQKMQNRPCKPRWQSPYF